MTRVGKQTEGSQEDLKAEAWADLFKRGRVKYLAALRNARRIIEQAPDCVSALCQKLISVEDIRGSKVLPFQFLTARQAVAEVSGPYARAVLGAIETGCEIALSNVPLLEGSTLVCLDDSASMASRPLTSSFDPKAGWSKLPVVVGSMFAVALAKANPDCDVMLFSDTARYVTLPAGVPIFAGMAQLTQNLRGCGTNFHAPFQVANRAYDRILMLSDTQGWMGGRTPDASLVDYERRHGKRPFVYCWDIVGSSSCQFPAPRVFFLAGISDRAFDAMKSLETDREALVKAIEAVEL